MFTVRWKRSALNELAALMCENCERAVNEQAWEQLEEVAADPKTNCWVTRCPLCKQLWETNAYQPHFSWELTIEEAKAKYPESSF